VETRNIYQVPGEQFFKRYAHGTSQYVFTRRIHPPSRTLSRVRHCRPGVKRPIRSSRPPGSRGLRDHRPTVTAIASNRRRGIISAQLRIQIPRPNEARENNRYDGCACAAHAYTFFLESFYPSLPGGGGGGGGECAVREICRVRIKRTIVFESFRGGSPKRNAAAEPVPIYRVRVRFRRDREVAHPPVGYVVTEQHVNNSSRFFTGRGDVLGFFRRRHTSATTESVCT